MKRTKRIKIRSVKFSERHYELIGIVLCLIGILSAFGIFGVNAGFVGNYLEAALTCLFGVGALLFASVMFLSGLYFITEHKFFTVNARFFGFMLMFTMFLTLYHYIKIPVDFEIMPESVSMGGGVLGGGILLILRNFFGETLCAIVIFAGILASVILSTNWSLGEVLLVVKDKASKIFAAVILALMALKNKIQERIAEKKELEKHREQLRQEQMLKKKQRPKQSVQENFEEVDLYNQEWDDEYISIGSKRNDIVDKPQYTEETEETNEEQNKPKLHSFWQDLERKEAVQKAIETTLAVGRSEIVKISENGEMETKVVNQSQIYRNEEIEKANITPIQFAKSEVVEAEKEEQSVTENTQTHDSDENSEMLWQTRINLENTRNNPIEKSQVIPEFPVEVEENLQTVPPAEPMDSGKNEEGVEARADAFTSSPLWSESCDEIPAFPSDDNDELDLSNPDFDEEMSIDEDMENDTRLTTQEVEQPFKPSENISEKLNVNTYNVSNVNQVSEHKETRSVIPGKPYELPEVNNILSKRVKKENLALKIEIEDNARVLSKTLSDFKVNANIINACHGPAVTRYELEPAPGVKVSKITGLAEDIALALAATSVRIEPIPGKSAIGVEVPNKELEGVQLREVLERPYFEAAESKLTVGLGMDIGGQAIFADLAKMPHLLIAGSTGSGKSVCVNTLITSILFKAKPDEVKFILIDPKMVELSNYNGIPHLMVPVVTDAKKAASVLNWAVQEMEKRYSKFAEKVVRNMETYNSKFPDDKMSAIVIIIDELADLMMVAPHDVEDAICRLAQKARAAGIHLVLATQRPSVDVITGIIKANIPSRIAFAVSSQIDSRTILDQSGAEKLLGRGDMLFYPIGSPKPRRVQGAFVSDEEVEMLLDFIKGQGVDAEINEEIEHFTENDTLSDDKSNKGKKDDSPKTDELLLDAVELVISTGQASASNVQRRFRVGYARAGRLIDTMEILGIVGPSSGSKPRDILMSVEDAIKAVESLQ